MKSLASPGSNQGAYNSLEPTVPSFQEQGT